MDAATLIKQAFKEFIPPKRQLISDWASEHFELPETSAEPGKWSKDRAAYQPGILDAVCEPGVQKVTLMCSAQIGKTPSYTLRKPQRGRCAFFLTVNSRYLSRANSSQAGQT